MADRNECVFLVRMWRERSNGPLPAWRGSVRHVASGVTLFVGSPLDVADFIALRLNEADAPADSDRDAPR